MIRATGTALLGGAIAICAFLFAIPSLYVPGVALLLLGAAAGPWTHLGARNAGIRCEASPRTLTEGEPLEVTLVVELGRWPVAGGQLVGPHIRRSLRAGARGTVRLRATRNPARRGRYPLEPVSLAIGDPLGLAVRTIEGHAPEVTVLPRTEAIRRPPGSGAGGRAASGGMGAADETDIDGLGPYRWGAPASRIHWPTLARLGDLMERRLVAELESQPLVVLDARDPVSATALDQAVRAAASLSLALARAGGCRVLLPGDRRPTHLGPELRGWASLHTRLALVEATAAEPWVRPSRTAGSLYWVTANRRVPRASARDRQFLVSPVVSAQGPVAFTVAGCSGGPLRGASERAA